MTADHDDGGFRLTFAESRYDLSVGSAENDLGRRIRDAPTAFRVPAPTDSIWLQNLEMALNNSPARSSLSPKRQGANALHIELRFGRRISLSLSPGRN